MQVEVGPAARAIANQAHKSLPSQASRSLKLQPTAARMALVASRTIGLNRTQPLFEERPIDAARQLHQGMPAIDDLIETRP
jgi:hypothetical protein